MVSLTGPCCMMCPEGMKRAENLKNADWMKAGQQRVAAATAAIGVGLVASKYIN